MTSDKVVYLHRRESDNEIFYIGMGSDSRPYDSVGRSNYWKSYVNKYGNPIIEILQSSLSVDEAIELEMFLIELIGRRDLDTGTLVNLTVGGEGIVGSTCLNKPLICLETGLLFDSIKSYCDYTGEKHSSVSMFLNSTNSKRIPKNVRFVEDNRIIWKKEIDIDTELMDRDVYCNIDGVDLICEDYDYELDSLTQKSIDNFNKNYKELSYYDKNIIELLVLEGYSLSKLSEATGIGRSSIYNTYCNAIDKVKLNKNTTDTTKGTYKLKKLNENKLRNYILKSKNN